jgi:2-amino-4-hydroxy-6-hydroxymethyldihydropteridine diphosphokinase
VKGQRVFIGLGGNIDDPIQQVQQAMRELSLIRESRLVAKSSLYSSAPVGLADQPDFVNAVVWMSTSLDPGELLDELHRIERDHGRVRRERNGPRTLDLDLLLFDDLTLKDARIHIPHPRMHERAFVLLPLAEIAPETTIPQRGKVQELLATVTHQGVTRINVA